MIMRARLTVLSLAVVVCCTGCGLLESVPPKPRDLEADISFNDAGDRVTIINNNKDPWRKLYFTLIDDYQRRYYYIDTELLLPPGRALTIQLSEFKDENGFAFEGTKENHWRWRIEDATRIWRLQRATQFPTG